MFSEDLDIELLEGLIDDNIDEDIINDPDDFNEDNKEEE